MIFPLSFYYIMSINFLEQKNPFLRCIGTHPCFAHFCKADKVVFLAKMCKENMDVSSLQNAQKHGCVQLFLPCKNAQNMDVSLED